MRIGLSLKLLTYLILFVFPFIVYSPVILTNYAFLDDYTATAFGMQHIQNLTTTQVMDSGRPLYAVFIREAFGAVRGISDLRFVRAFGIAGIGALCIAAYRALVRVDVAAPAAFCVALMLGLMPSYQVIAGWAITAPYPWAALSAAIAFNMQNSVNPDWRRVSGSMLLLTVATTIYQPAAMVFWVFAAIAWLIPGRLPSIRSFSRAALIVIMAATVDFVLIKVLPIFFVHAASDSRAVMTHDVAGKILWFVKYPIFEALNLFSIEPSVRRAVLVAAICCVGFIAIFRRQAVYGIAIALALLPAAYLPNLMTAGDWGAYRTQVALGGIVLVIATASVLELARAMRFTRFVPLLGALMLGWATFSSYQNVKYDFALPSWTEYRLISRGILATEFQPNDRACFVLPAPESDAARDHRYDEFGINSSAALWVPDPMVYLILSHQHSKDAGLFSRFGQFPNTQVLPGCKQINLQAMLAR